MTEPTLTESIAAIQEWLKSFDPGEPIDLDTGLNNRH